MELKFTKMHGCGNDYIYFDAIHQEIPDPESLSIRLSDRHFGIGGDGIVLIAPSGVADAKMRMFNIDGSEGKMCGNAIRCVGKYLYDHGMVHKENITIETLSGIKALDLNVENGKVNLVRVDMGAAVLSPEFIPVNIKADKVIHYTTSIAEGTHTINCVSMGNPHCVLFEDEIDSLDLEKIGPKFENDQLFPERVNTEFVQVISPNVLRMRVWERGSGETWACGTGACASAVAAVENGISPWDQPIKVILRGGELEITVTKQTVYMTGGAQKVFEGVVEA